MTLPAPPLTARGSDRTVNRLALLIYGGGAVFLAPWIVLLYLSQPQEAGAYHLKLTSLGMSVFSVVALLVSAAAFRKRASTAVVWGTSAATYLFISGWFNTLTTNHGPLAIVLLNDALVKMPLIVLSIWFALNMTRTRGSNVAVPRWFPNVCLAAAIVFIPLFITAASVTPRTAQLHNLRLFWTGLDVFELIGMALTGWYLLRRSPNVAIAATITGSIMFSDAWFNVVTTVGNPHRAALVMAVVEVPIAIYSFRIARRQVSSWSLGLAEPVLGGIR
ncbi:MAG TPA: hypothetical protein VNG12_18180 [Acidimicrobiales bacterium]|nr:hypothetical protein [Acidimicrobiales bacterium]